VGGGVGGWSRINKQVSLYDFSQIYWISKLFGVSPEAGMKIQSDLRI